VSYCVLADLKLQLSEAELIELTDDAALGEIDESVTTRAVADADGEIDAYLGMRYPVPLTTVPAIIRKLSVDISIRNLYVRRGDVVPKNRDDRYAAAVKLLEKIADGKISLGANDPDGNPPDTGGIDYSAEDQVFTSDKLGNY
jgi:phage gp36-like protein